VSHDDLHDVARMVVADVLKRNGIDFDGDWSLRPAQVFDARYNWGHLAIRFHRFMQRALGLAFEPLPPSIADNFSEVPLARLVEALASWGNRALILQGIDQEDRAREREKQKYLEERGRILQSIEDMLMFAVHLMWGAAAAFHIRDLDEARGTILAGGALKKDRRKRS